MIEKGKLQEYSKQWESIGYSGIEHIKDERTKLREVYDSQSGKSVFYDFLRDSLLFETIVNNENVRASVAVRNHAIYMLEKMGFLDEENIEKIIDFMFTLPLFGYENN